MREKFLEGPYRWELLFLILMMLVMPFWETPKSLFFVAYVGVWLFNRFQSGDWAPAWNVWDTVIAVWIGAAMTISVASVWRGMPWKGLLDILRYTLLFW